MSASLRNVLDQRVGSGVYRIAAGEVAAAVAMAERAQWRVVKSSSSAPVTKATTLAAFKASFGFPEWFGHNLDALADSLSDVADAPGTMLVWTGSEALAAADERAYQGIVSVLRDRAADATLPRFVTLLAP